MEYVWVTGPSAIGKSTLANRLANTFESKLRERLGIADSVQLLGYPASLEQLAALDESKTGLVIWQHNDDHFIGKLAALNPPAMQRIILVWRPIMLHLVGYKEKRLRCYPTGFTADTPEEKWLADLCGDRNANFAKLLEHSAMGITVVDASADYAILPELPKDDELDG